MVVHSNTAHRGVVKALVLESFDSPLALRDVERPSPGPRDVLVKVGASGVNPLDVKIRAGAAAHARVSPPAILGIDLAGTVVDVGSDVGEFAIGDTVFGMTGGVGDLQGSLAEYAAVDADLLARAPQVNAETAAALPLSAITAWTGLYEQADVQAGHRVLVHGGAGGVGHIAVQLALGRGATVYATGTGASLDVIRGLGAVPIDRTDADVRKLESLTDGVGFDIVFDTVGGAVLDQSFGLVRRRTGRVVSILGWGSHSLAPLSFREAAYSGVFALQPLLDGIERAHHSAILREVAALVDAGDLTPIVDPEVFGFDSVEKAHRKVETGSARGKVVVRVPG